MTLDSLLRGVDAWPLSAAIRGDLPGTEWIFPLVETGHVMAVALVFGSIFIVDLRLLGVAMRETPVTSLASEMLPWTWVAWCLAAAFGIAMFISHPARYLDNWSFDLKFVCMALAALNMLIFQLLTFRSVAHWDADRTTPAAKVAGAVSILLWTAVVYFGRLIGFSDS